MRSPCPFKLLKQLIFTKLGINIAGMPLEATQISYFLISHIGNNNMLDAQSCEVGVTQAPLTIGSQNDEQKYAMFVECKTTW
jgi:hypothetical protein